MQKAVSDPFDIAGRIKLIDDGYFILFNTKRGIYEIHNSKQKHTYCLSTDKLCEYALKQVRLSRTVNLAKTLREMDEYNEKLEKDAEQQLNARAKDEMHFLIKSMGTFV